MKIKDNMPKPLKAKIVNTYDGVYKPLEIIGGKEIEVLHEKHKFTINSTYDDSKIKSDIEKNTIDILTNKSNINTLNKNVENLKEKTEKNAKNIELVQGDLEATEQALSETNEKVSKNTINVAKINENLQNYSLTTETGNKIELKVNSDYVVKLNLLNKNNEILSSGNIDLPIEQVVVDMSYNEQTKKLIITLENGVTREIPLDSLVSGLVNETTFNSEVNKINDTLKALNTNVSNNTKNITNLTDKEQKDVNAINNTIEEQKAQIEALEQENSYLKANQLKETPTLEKEYHLEDSAYMPLDNVEVAGDMYQKTTSGKNKLPYSDDSISHTNNGFTITSDGKGTYSIVGAGTSSGNYEYELIKKYTIQSNDYLHLKNSIVNSNIAFALRKSDNTQIMYASLNVVDRIIDLSQYAGEEISSIRIASNQQTITTPITIQPMITSEKTTTEYEPYTGGQPSPSPNYPQEIKVVSGDVNVKVQNKNLLDVSQSNEYILTTQDPDYTLNYDKGKINVKVNSLPKTYSQLGIFYEFKTTIGKKYSIKAIGNFGSGKALRNARVYNDKDSTTMVLDLVNTIPQTFTATQETYYFRIWIANQIGEGDIYCQLEEGSIATSYEPHEEQNYPLSLGNIELCGNEQVRDRILYKDGKFYLEKKWGKYQLDGSETDWSRPTTNLFNNNIENYYFANTSICNAISNITTNMTNDNSNGDFLARTSNLDFAISLGPSKQLRIKNTNLTSLNDFKTWLSNNNVEIIYQLKEPTMTEITDETLINQLKALQKALTYKNITNISIDSEFSPYLELTYTKDLEKVIADLQAMIIN